MKRLLTGSAIFAAGRICIFLLLCCAALLIFSGCKTAEVVPEPPVIHRVYYIHGWKSNEEDLIRPQKILQEIFPESEIIIRRWTSKSWNFEKCAKQADSEAGKLAEDIEKLPPKEREAVTLVGHSLGSKIVVNSMAQLADKDVKIGRGILIGAAIPSDYPLIGKAVSASRLPCVNIYNPDDSVLDDFYFTYKRFFRWKSIHALGASGYDRICRKKRFFQIRFDLEEDFGVIKTHYAEVYLQCLKEKVPEWQAAELSEELDYSTMDVRIPVKLNSWTLKSEKLMNEELLEEKYGWKFFKYHCEKKLIKKMPIWPSITAYVIRDQRGRLVGWSSDRAKAEAGWETVKNEIGSMAPDF